VLAVHGGAGRIVPEELGVARAAAARRGLEAGRGAVLTAASDVEPDAAVADGATRRAGAVTCISGEVLDRLIALTEATFTQMEAWRDAMPDSGQLQDAVQANVATTRTLLSYSPIVIPGLLQTPTYAEHTLRLTNYTGRFDEAAALAGRWRRQEALADRSRRFDTNATCCRRDSRSNTTSSAKLAGGRNGRRTDPPVADPVTHPAAAGPAVVAPAV
jgi:hypothetical protein